MAKHPNEFKRLLRILQNLDEYRYRHYVALGFSTLDMKAERRMILRMAHNSF